MEQQTNVDCLFFGFEISTQQVKVIIVDNELNIQYKDTILFDTELPEFSTHAGVHIHDDRLTVTTPTALWVKAIDLALTKMKRSGVDFARIAAVSGTGQQHGSVYWAKEARATLQNLKAEKTLHDQLSASFSIPDSPLWMDSSTDKWCRRLESQLGGAQRLAFITGSSAQTRLTGNQIAKLYETESMGFSNTERISLVSSFGASIFLGDYAPIDYSDGSGMNLLDIWTKKWSTECLQACVPDGSLEAKLGAPVPSHSDVGPISQYMVDRYGFHPKCRVIAFTGDNPASLAGLLSGNRDIILSLGTSDTVFASLDKPNPHESCSAILVNPTNQYTYMGMLVWKNGSLTREKIRDSCAEGSWDTFDRLLKSTPAGNNGHIGIYFDEQEITPCANGVYRFNNQNALVYGFSAEVEVRAVIEGQMLARLSYCGDLGVEIRDDTKIIVTGGASSNEAILQVVADVFGAPVYVTSEPNSACLGCAYRAKHGWINSRSTYIPYYDVVTMSKLNMAVAAQPNPDATKLYKSMVQRYKKLEEQIVRH
ncbi:PREDICTED: xylulose kinase-like [Priapulus caudatus]|uniref:Xylulose kinase n=1 Tax=Priapulus caudatus TaxID=37621 RepID=A0ABM1DQX3_PRICU|nr:PREDICTED: xylulose kinase-like [Priapulus caudatus]